LEHSAAKLVEYVQLAAYIEEGLSLEVPQQWPGLLMKLVPELL
jgi:hypothetical protein